MLRYGPGPTRSRVSCLTFRLYVLVSKRRRSFVTAQFKLIQAFLAPLAFGPEHTLFCCGRANRSLMRTETNNQQTIRLLLIHIMRAAGETRPSELTCLLNPQLFVYNSQQSAYAHTRKSGHDRSLSPVDIRQPLFRNTLRASETSVRVVSSDSGLLTRRRPNTINRRLLTFLD